MEIDTTFSSLSCTLPSTLSPNHVRTKKNDHIIESPSNLCVIIEEDDDSDMETVNCINDQLLLSSCINNDCGQPMRLRVILEENENDSINNWLNDCPYSSTLCKDIKNKRRDRPLRLSVILEEKDKNDVMLNWLQKHPMLSQRIWFSSRFNMTNDSNKDSKTKVIPDRLLLSTMSQLFQITKSNKIIPQDENITVSESYKIPHANFMKKDESQSTVASYETGSCRTSARNQVVNADTCIDAGIGGESQSIKDLESPDPRHLRSMWSYIENISNRILITTKNCTHRRRAHGHRHGSILAIHEESDHNKSIVECAEKDKYSYNNDKEKDEKQTNVHICAAPPLHGLNK